MSNVKLAIDVPFRTIGDSHPKIRAGTVTACPASPRCRSCRSCPSSMAKIAIREQKTGLQKSRKARKGPWEALHGPLPSFRDIYPWKQKGFEIGPFFALFHFGAMELDNSGQFWTILDRNRHCTSGGQSLVRMSYEQCEISN